MPDRKTCQTLKNQTCVRTPNILKKNLSSLSLKKRQRSFKISLKFELLNFRMLQFAKKSPPTPERNVESLVLSMEDECRP